jgi:hypothetical protein
MIRALVIPKLLRYRVEISVSEFLHRRAWSA